MTSTQPELIITGASGFLGSHVIPRLQRMGVPMLLVGRDPQKLAARYPGLTCCALDEVADRGAGAHSLLHLAVCNNDSGGDDAEFHEVNVTGFEHVLQICRSADVCHVIYPASFHADPASSSAYGRSKFAAETLLAQQENFTVMLLRLPAVYGVGSKGKLAAMQQLPAVMRTPARHFLACLKPVADVTRVSIAICDAVQNPRNGTIWVADPQECNPIYCATARLIDLGFAVAVIAFGWFALLLVSGLIKCSSPGPSLFLQTRVGRGQRTFICYKFRSMYEGTKQVGTHEVSGDSVTGIGAFMRRMKIDELPQVINLIKGELSLIGPRPCLPVQVELISERAERGVFDIRPGISGLAQVKGIDMSDPVRLAELDAEYKARRTTVLDLKIILDTVRGKGGGDWTL
jgi:lipopolysaccharide/colanic/teichoic acid biosynthesis glycosyltransferase